MAVRGLVLCACAGVALGFQSPVARRPTLQASKTALSAKKSQLLDDLMNAREKAWSPTITMGASTTMGATLMPPSMVAGAAGYDGGGDMYDGVRIGPPPDLASLLLHNRIVYLGMAMVPAVTELIVAELLYLNYESATKPIMMYINSPGTIDSQGRTVGFETEAFAIADCMKYVKPPVSTICVGQAFGAAAMLLSQGCKGQRFCLPNASIMLHQPRSMARGQASDIAIKAKEVMVNRRVQCELLAKACGKPTEDILRDAARTMYLQPEEAVSYGLIDKVLTTVGKETSAPKPSFMNMM